MTETIQPLLVASDIDGTFIDSRERVTPRLRAVVTRMLRHGTPLVLATGRPARWLKPVLDQLPVRPLCVCANGAVIYDAARDEVVSAKTLEPETLHYVVKHAREATASVGGIGVAAERAGTSAYDAIDELFVVAPSYDHAWESDEHGLIAEEAVLAKSATKLLLRNPDLNSAQLYELIAPVIDASRAHVTYSMPDGLLEVSAPGVTKRAGLEYVSELVGATSADVVCFGDMPNDIEMLAWAGTGVAMGNAADKVKQIADEITATNDDDGVAQVLERWF
ncbi:MAG: HAD family hydrolase [Corynebacterium sp.]|uniref:HAD family hydrolase n=1 Tax=Corynebacterium sp. TaxID=1720 RepID=UPI0026DC8C23|nr:HAD family hydrolase [Corynebacterium sp.]MDO5029962.1 HAD family hydrolase [Corynebacterium sp.]